MKDIVKAEIESNRAINKGLKKQGNVVRDGSKKLDKLTGQ